MVNASDPKDRRSARIAIVEQHIRLENDHDLERVLRTFGETARYDDEPRGEHYKYSYEHTSAQMTLYGRIWVTPRAIA